ncbi:Dolichyl-diphosphooligosaccharide--protein glycosyltransferase subunit DAD1 [Rhynchospora pubera]|nr:Dolichyl-diphosphooligosaccharide--protein glycosyltransferase subunit DAD1 [Rhynchospora pubera]
MTTKATRPNKKPIYFPVPPVSFVSSLFPSAINKIKRQNEIESDLISVQLLHQNKIREQIRCAIEMAKSTNDAQLLIQSLRKAYAATPTNLKIIDLYVVYAVATALIQVGYMAIVGSFPFNSFLSGVLSCVGTAVLAVCLRIQVNKDNKEFKDLPPERAFADFILCNLVLHLVIMNFLG